MAKKRAKKSNDVSKKSIAVLLVIAVLISVIGTWLVLTQEPTINYRDETGKQGQTYLRFEIENNQPPQPITGGVVLGFTIE